MSLRPTSWNNRLPELCQAPRQSLPKAEDLQGCHLDRKGSKMVVYECLGYCENISNVTGKTSKLYYQL